MKNITLEIINKIHECGYEAYAVGGYVRDMLLNIKSKDVDLTTSATPMELKKIFKNIKIHKENYGSVSLVYKNIRFEITTYRKESNYTDNRHPDKIEYVGDLKTDLLRRDFTINTICMDKDGNIVDLLNGKSDLDKRIIKTVAESNKSFQDDSLRILRAIRFATIFDFKLSDKVANAIENNKELLKNLSLDRKKSELDRIFGSKRAKEGISFLKQFGLLEVLNLENISRVKDYSDIIGIWAMINTNVYNFTNSEKDLIKKINEVYKLDNLNKHVLYKYGLYVNVLAGLNKGFSKKKIIETYQSLPIQTRNDIDINALKICEVLNRKPDQFITEIYNDLELEIINGNLRNEECDIVDYILDKYKALVENTN